MAAINDGVENEIASGDTPNETVLSPSEPQFNEMVRTRLPAQLEIASEGADLVAGSETAIRTMAGGLDRERSAPADRRLTLHVDGLVAAAVETLAHFALETDDPVAALDQGADALAEALAARDVAMQERVNASHERRIDEQAAYRHARLHRVTELIDLGYSLDQGVAIANANEAEIRGRALAAGRDPMERIYKYALLNGHRGARPGLAPLSARGGQAIRSATSRRDGEPSVLEALAAMSDDAFAETTKGDRWRELLGG